MYKTVGNMDVQMIIERNFDWSDLINAVGKTGLIRILDKSKVAIKEEIAERFRTERGPSGKKWKKLSPFTIATKKGSSRILSFSGKLARGISVRRKGNNVVVTSDTVYGKMHQMGAKYQTTKRQSVYLYHNLFKKTGSPFTEYNIKLPSRPFLGFNTRLIKRIISITTAEMKRAESVGKHGA